MDTTLNIKSFSAESIHACVAACGGVDRAYQNTDNSYIPEIPILKENAGLMPPPIPRSRDAMIAKGAFEWLQEFHATDKPFPLSNTSVKALHQKLFRHSPRDDGTRGNYRINVDNDMRSLFEETKKNLGQHDRHPLFIISLFRVSFINLMPFITGNAQCANLIAYALLRDNNYPIVSRIPLVASLNNPDGPISHDPIVLLPNTLFNLLKTYSNLHIKNIASQAYLNSRRQLLLNCIQNDAPLKISDIMAVFPEQNRNTVKKDLIFLKEKDFILSSGVGRGMVYWGIPDQKPVIGKFE
jgi:hypothetical protein